MSVARSSNIEGPYLTLAEDGNWQDNPRLPKIIMKAKNMTTLQAPYGAGQQSVLWRGGEAYMWYVDDTIFGSPPGLFVAISDDGINFVSQETNLSHVPTHSPDIKYDVVNKQFVLLQIVNPHTVSTGLAYRTSKDGINWSDQIIIKKEPDFPAFAHNPGLLSNQLGEVDGVEDIFVGFGAPYDLVNTDTWGKWQLQGRHYIALIPPSPTIPSFPTSTPIPTTIPGDLNNNHVIDLDDFMQWKVLYTSNQTTLNEFLEWKNRYVVN